VAPLVALIGFMGSGKTTVGRRLGQLLGWRFADLDEEIVESRGMTIPQIFSSEGEPAFRGYERARVATILDSLPEQEGLVLALGGGTLEDAETRAALKARAGLVYLEIEPEAAWQRARGSGRPLAQGKKAFEELLVSRLPMYEEVADWVLPASGRTVEELAAEIAEDLGAARDRWAAAWGRRLRATGRPSVIVGGRGALDDIASHALEAGERGRRAFVITDVNVQEAWGRRVNSLLGPMAQAGGMLVLEPGEETKNVSALESCWDWLAERGARRDDVVVALGGGVIGDLAGLAAATYQRGISLWQIPTSLLAQVDSSVGGKTAINLGTGKNLVGAFYQPDLVIVDPETMKSLPEVEYRGGLGEVVKYGLLRSEGLLARLEDDAGRIAARDGETLSELVKVCVAYKADVVEDDEFDKGGRAVLNLGHTIAHALEVTCGYGAMTHGQAVALGLLPALMVSERMLGLPSSVRSRVRDLLVSFGLDVVVDIPDTATVIEATRRDKKVVAGSSGFVGLRAVGDPVWGLDVPAEVFADALEVIRR